MKKFARLMAVVLAGVMMLSMTACSGVFNEDAARKAILDEINAYRKEINCDPVEEYKELDDLASAFMKVFEEKNATVLKDDGIAWDTYYEIDAEIRNKWDIGGEEHVGYKEFEDKDREYCYILTCEYVSREMLKAQIRPIYELTSSDCNAIGIGFAKVDGKIYWCVEIFAINS